MAPPTTTSSTSPTTPSPDAKPRNIIIIGAGIIGTTTAYYLTRHPSFNPTLHKITLLEATTIAGGASGKAGGLLALWAYPSSLVPVSYRLHKELADEHGGVERWGYRAVHCAQVECVGRKVEGKGGDGGDGRRDVRGKRGVMDGDNDIPKADGRVGTDVRDGEKERVSLLKRNQDAMKRLRAAGVPADLDWVDPEALKAYEQMGDPSTTAQVHPFQFTNAMAQLAREKGVEIRERAVVKRINYTADGKGVESVTYEDRGGSKVNGVASNGNGSSATNGKANGDDTSSSSSSSSSSQQSSSTTTLPATDIIVTAGPWTRSVLPTAPIAALRAHSVTIRPSRPVSAYALFTQIKLSSGFSSSSSPSNSGPKIPWGRPQYASPEIYARPRNEVYACGEGDRLVPLPSFSDEVAVDESRCQDIVDQVASVSEELRDGEVTARQACYLPNVTSGGDPLVGRTNTSGLFVAAGHTCWGIQNGPATGKLMSEFVFEGEARSAKVGGLDPRRVL